MKAKEYGQKSRDTVPLNLNRKYETKEKGKKEIVELRRSRKRGCVEWSAAAAAAGI